MSECTHPPGVCLFGTGEYTTGFAAGRAATSDKSCGVAALVMLDLRLRGRVSRIGMCGVNGPKLPAVREHMAAALGPFQGLDPRCIETWPEDDVVDQLAYRKAIESFSPGDVAIIFTPDHTHADIATACFKRGMHVLITKPPTKTLNDHELLVSEALKAKVLAAVEVHKRYDPIYIDARDRISRNLGPFSFFSSYMSQPKRQLETFRAWAGKNSDISYYLNSHHIDFHVWCLRGSSRPELVTALYSDGVANRLLEDREDHQNTEDTITLAVQWRNRSRCAPESSGSPGATGLAPQVGESQTAEHESPGPKRQRIASSSNPLPEPTTSFAGGSVGHATYTASWIAPRSDVHSQQRWFYMGQAGELSVDQAHRGYSGATDESGFGSINPLFWKPTRDAVTGRFNGQQCYGYRSFEAFVDACIACNGGKASPRDFEDILPTLSTTLTTTAILEAGRRSIESGGQPWKLLYQDEFASSPIGMKPAHGTS